MSFEINSVIIGGNLAKDVALKTIPSGQKVASMVVASNRTYMVNGEQKKEVLFMDIDVWGVQAENCNKYLKKGSPVVCTGRLRQEQWQTDAGEKRSRIKVVATNVQFLSSPKSGAGVAAESAKEPDGFTPDTNWETP
ncbi:MAG: single-stranded DNA-binding protein [Candidatus Omnitrophica bacterium]|nr:single-stranded DNA-binding protein [Candidatus Omnitrophota bacterium]